MNTFFSTVASYADAPVSADSSATIIASRLRADSAAFLIFSLPKRIQCFDRLSITRGAFGNAGGFAYHARRYFVVARDSSVGGPAIF
jgi:hypothetical protein